MTWNEDFGYSFTSLSGFILYIGLFFMLSFLYILIRDVFYQRAFSNPKENLLVEICSALFIWVLLWIPFIGLLWVIGKLGI
jgi:hypothetical protein